MLTVASSQRPVPLFRHQNSYSVGLASPLIQNHTIDFYDYDYENRKNEYYMCVIKSVHFDVRLAGFQFKCSPEKNA